MLTKTRRFFSLFTDIASELGAFELVPKADFARGLRQLHHQAMRIAHEVVIAEDDGVPLGEAVTDHARYPSLARAHEILMTLPQWPAPAPIDAWLEKALVGPRPEVVDTLRSTLVSTAIEHRNPLVQAMARFAIFEAIALNLRILLLEQPEELTRYGIRDDTLATVAGTTLYHVISEHRTDPSRPPLDFERIVQIAAHGLEGHVKEIHRALGKMNTDLQYALNFRAKLAKAIAQASFPKATLLRNVYAPYFHEQRLTTKLLVERFSSLGSLFPSEEACRKQVSRAQDKLEEEGPTAFRSRERRFIDIVMGRPAPAKRIERLS